jgi:soluble lytic murein transglycosylase-like protein
MPKITTDPGRPDATARLPAWFPHERLLLGLRTALHPVGEFIHVSAIYLGLAVLTTLALSLVLPSMRQQSRQLHEVVLAMFQADGEGDGAGDETDSTAAADWSLITGPAQSADGAAAPPASGDTGRPAVASSDQAAPASATPQGAEPAPAAEAESNSSDLLNFAQALVASLRDQPISGVTKAQDHALRSYLARKYRIAPSVAGAMVRTAFAIGRELHVDPQLLLAVIAIESRYNPFVESAVGAQGLMQVMSSVHRDKLTPRGGLIAVFNPVVNIRVGAQILADCIRRRGSVEGGLACYVGAAGPDDDGYGARVLAERRRIALASGIPPGKG